VIHQPISVVSHKVVHGLGWPAGWIGSRFCSFWWAGLGRIWQCYTIHNCKGPCKLNTRGYEKLAFSTNISIYFENSTRYGHSYNGKPLTADSFAVSCIGLGWVGSIFWDLRWVGLGHSVDGLGWVGSGHRQLTHGPLWLIHCSVAAMSWIAILNNKKHNSTSELCALYKPIYLLTYLLNNLTV